MAGRMGGTTLWRVGQLLLCAWLLLVSGCANQHPAGDEKVATPVGEEIVTKDVPEELVGGEKLETVDDAWIREFNDPILNELVVEALAAYPGKKIGTADLKQANQLLAEAVANLLPATMLGGGGLNGQSGDREPGLSIKALIQTVSWEDNVWRLIKPNSSTEPRWVAEDLAPEFCFARQSLVGSIARGWFMAVTSKLLQKIINEGAAVLEKGVAAAEMRRRTGQGGKKDIRMAREALASFQVASRSAAAARKRSLESLALLLGRSPSQELEGVDSLVALPPPVPPSLSSVILERRPDLVAAESRAAMLFSRENDQTLLHLPPFQFSTGSAISSLNDVIATLSNGIFASLYQGGYLEDRVDAATLEQQDAVRIYAETAMHVFEEVEWRMAAEGNLLQRSEYLQSEVLGNLLSYEQNRQTYEVGLTELGDFLPVQNRWVASQIAELDVGSRRLINRTALHLAIGGSFDE